jgi:phosphatidylglycerophosphate synthase
MMTTVTEIRLPGRFCLRIEWLIVRAYIPTTLTIIRFFSPAYLFPLLLNGHPFYFTAVATLSALTDWLDGDLARRWRCESERGAELDIYADKVLCWTLMGAVLSTPDGWSHWVPIAILLVYHTVVIVMRVVGNLLFKSSRVAKLKMAVEMPGLIMAFAFFGVLHLQWINIVGITAIWTAAGLSCWSMLHYNHLAPDWPEKLWPRKA